MKSFLEIAGYVLKERGPMEPSALAKESLRLVRTEKLPETLKKAASRVMRMRDRSLAPFSLTLLHCALAKEDEHGFTVVEYPSFRLRTQTRPDWLPRVGWQNAAYKALLPSKEYMGLREIYDKVVQNANFRFSPGCPECQLYHSLTNAKGRKLFSHVGTFRIGLEPGRQQGQLAGKTQAVSKQPVQASQMAQKIHEANLEELIAEDLNRVEQGLTLVGRQYSAPPVGRIDLLCKDRRGDLVVIEIKRFRASTESIIDQATRYMGWVEQHLARSGQRVRGILVVGKPDAALTYSVRAIRNLSIMCLDVSLTTYKAPRADRRW